MSIVVELKSEDKRKETVTTSGQGRIIEFHFYWRIIHWMNCIKRKLYTDNYC